MWIPANATVPPGRTICSATRHELARGREHDRAVTQGRVAVGCRSPTHAAPIRAELAGGVRRG